MLYWYFSRPETQWYQYMQLNQVSLLLEANDIKGVIVTPAVMQVGKWIISFERRNGQPFALTARRDNIRHFASVDSAIKVLKELGITTAVVDWR